jgi:CO/xanthine dehydrogenase Mo-binding subunit
MKRDALLCKGIGELPFNCVPAAYIQAVSQAIDYPFEKIPLTPPDLRNVEKERLDGLPRQNSSHYTEAVNL